MPETLAPLQYAKVIGRFVTAVADTGADVDEYPDVEPLSGTIDFVPSASVLTIQGASPVPTTVITSTITGKLTADGYLTGVYLIATNDTATNPTGFTYRADFHLTYKNQPVTVPSFNFDAPKGGIVDLSKILPTNANPGVITINAPVTSVAGKTGAVGLLSTDLPDLVERIQDVVAGFIGAGSNVTLNYNDAANTLTISSTSAGGSGLDTEAVRDAIGIALVGVGNIAITVNDAADTITISTTATANSTDAALRDRATHTGFQPAATISDFNAAVDARVTSILNTWGVIPTIWADETTNTFPARTVPTGYTRGWLYWNKQRAKATPQPAAAINGDALVEEKP